MVKVLLSITLALYASDSNRVTCFQSSPLSGKCCRSHVSIAPNAAFTSSPPRSKIWKQEIFGHIPASYRRLMALTNDSEDNSFLGRKGAPKITKVEELDDFLEFIAEDERLCIVKFYASWCKSCHKFGVKYRKLASEREGQVRFAEVEYGKSTSLCKTLKIRKLPYIMIHKAPVGKMAEFPCGPKYFDERLMSRLNQYLDMSDEELQFEQKMEGGSSLGNDILSQLSTDDANQPSI